MPSPFPGNPVIREWSWKKTQIFLHSYTKTRFFLILIFFITSQVLFILFSFFIREMSLEFSSMFFFLASYFFFGWYSFSFFILTSSIITYSRIYIIFFSTILLVYRNMFLKLLDDSIYLFLLKVHLRSIITSHIFKVVFLKASHQVFITKIIIIIWIIIFCLHKIFEIILHLFTFSHSSLSLSLEDIKIRYLVSS